MRLFHVSEESNIEVFIPRSPSRTDIDQNLSYVWAITDECLPNFLTPRDCPRIAYHIGKNATPADIERYFSSTNRYTVIIEESWVERMQNTTLYLYEFDPAEFTLQDEIAGYYVATTPQKPIAKHIVNDLFDALLKRYVELRIVENLWPYADQIKTSTLDWSLCRMKNATPRKE